MGDQDRSVAYVLDSFALFALLTSEPAAGRVRVILGEVQQGDATAAMCVVNLGEVYYRFRRDHGAQAASHALALVEALPIQFVGVDRDLALAAADLKAAYPMAYADCFAAALAQELDAAVVTGDPEFRQLEEIIRVEWL